MISDKHASLKPLLESSKGVHLTCYFLNQGNLASLRRQVRDAIAEAKRFLDPVMSPDEQKRFLEPLDALLRDFTIFKHMKGNVGVFRNWESFRVLNIPVDLEPTCLVATTFHVKPLLKWMQLDRDFLLLGLEDRAAQLYIGSQQSLVRIDTILFPQVLAASDSSDDRYDLKHARARKRQTTQTMSWLSDWIEELTSSVRPKLFIAGPQELTDAFFKNHRYSNIASPAVWPGFRDGQAFEIAAKIRLLLKKEAAEKVEQELREFRVAESRNLTKRDIFQIAKAATQGRVRKLVVAEEVMIFGKLDPRSGNLTLHPFDLDHEDDDILDDLAQTVLSHGGEVVVAPNRQIPQGEPILALLDQTTPVEGRISAPGFVGPLERVAQ